MVSGVEESRGGGKRSGRKKFTSPAGTGYVELFDDTDPVRHGLRFEVVAKRSDSCYLILEICYFGLLRRSAP